MIWKGVNGPSEGALTSSSQRDWEGGLGGQRGGGEREKLFQLSFSMSQVLDDTNLLLAFHLFDGCEKR